MTENPVEARADDFDGSTDHLLTCIDAFLDLTDEKAFVPHNLDRGSHAYRLLVAARVRLEASIQSEAKTMALLVSERASRPPVAGDGGERIADVKRELAERTRYVMGLLADLRSVTDLDDESSEAVLGYCDDIETAVHNIAAVRRRPLRVGIPPGASRPRQSGAGLAAEGGSPELFFVARKIPVAPRELMCDTKSPAASWHGRPAGSGAGAKT